MTGFRAALANTTTLVRAGEERPGRWMTAWYWLPGLAAGMIWWFAMRIFGATTFGFVAAVGGEALLTGARPWRGLVVTMDAWGSSAEQRSTVRRRGLIGTAGALFLALALWVLWSAINHGGNLMEWIWVLPPLWARVSMAWTMSWHKVDVSDQSFQDLHDATQHGTGSWIPLVVGLGLGVVLIGFEAVAAFGLSLVLTGLFLLWGRRWFGGMNQELQAASVVVMEVLSVIALVLFSAPPL